MNLKKFEQLTNEMKNGKKELTKEDLNTISEFIYSVDSSSVDIYKYIPTEILKRYPGICETALKEDSFYNYYKMPAEIKESNPQYSYKAVKSNASIIWEVPISVIKENPEIYKRAFMDYDARRIDWVILSNKDEMYKRLLKSDMLIESVPDEVYVEYPEIFISTLKNCKHNMDDKQIASIAEKIYKKDSTIYSQMIPTGNISAISTDIIKEHEKEFTEVLKRNPYEIKGLSEEALSECPELCEAAIEGNSNAIKYVSEEQLKQNPELAIKAVKKNKDAINYIPRNVVIENPEIITEAEKSSANHEENLIDEEMVKYQRISFERNQGRRSVQRKYDIDKNGKITTSLPHGRTELENEEMNSYLDNIDNDSAMYFDIPDAIKIKYPEITSYAIEREREQQQYEDDFDDYHYWKDSVVDAIPNKVYIENPEIFIEALKDRRIDDEKGKEITREMYKINPEALLQIIDSQGSTCLIPEEIVAENSELYKQTLEKSEVYTESLNRRRQPRKENAEVENTTPEDKKIEVKELDETLAKLKEQRLKEQNNHQFDD